jgi:hypothetical protein
VWWTLKRSLQEFIPTNQRPGRHGAGSINPGMIFEYIEASRIKQRPEKQGKCYVKKF